MALASKDNDSYTAMKSYPVIKKSSNHEKLSKQVKDSQKLKAITLACDVLPVEMFVIT